jgi:glycosidase
MYPRDNVYAMYLTMGSHDTRRLLNELKNDFNKVRLAFLLQFANPGAPAIYYGDEIGMPGEKDPDNRRAFPWDESEWNYELRGYVQKLITARKKHAALRRGEMARVHLSEDNRWYAFSRILGEEKVIVVINPNDKAREVEIPLKKLNLPDGTLFEDVVTAGRYRMSNQTLKVTLAPWSGKMLATLTED